ncbi:hypothetical protein L484_017917 [Morus notabilis]|uniref:Uncharacterized protein n=1 Tax=Morus notabilis TaxID=981085 RepID=W9R948_9ROSA|nr:hypothetical protein L484_017917 [Morus notabilis]
MTSSSSSSPLIIWLTLSASSRGTVVYSSISLNKGSPFIEEERLSSSSVEEESGLTTDVEDGPF